MPQYTLKTILFNSILSIVLEFHAIFPTTSTTEDGGDTQMEVIDYFLSFPQL